MRLSVPANVRCCEYTRLISLRRYDIKRLVALKPSVRLAAPRVSVFLHDMAWTTMSAFLASIPADPGSAERSSDATNLVVGGDT